MSIDTNSESKAEEAVAAPVPEVSRARTASEVLLLELLDVAERRNWKRYAAALVRERSARHVEVLKSWRASTVAVPDKNRGSAAVGELPDNDAKDRRALAERLDSAISDADERRQAVMSLADEPEIRETRIVAEKLLDDHATWLSALPDELRGTVERDLSNAHRRFVLRGLPTDPERRQSAESNDQLESLHAHALAGLALSGGGVRSASFAIGTLQALSRLSLIRTSDFISAVSGGSWAAGWLAAWAYRHRNGIKGVEDELFKTLQADNATVRWVRRHIAYLAPRPGFASADSWALLVAYVANWLPILALVSLALLSIILLPHALSASAGLLASSLDKTGRWWTLGGAFILIVIYASIVRRLTLYRRDPGYRSRTSPGLHHGIWISTIVVTVFAAAAWPLVADAQGSAGHARAPSFDFESSWSLFPALVLFFMATAFASCLGAWALSTRYGQWLIDGVRRLFRRPMTRSGLLRRHPVPRLREWAALTLSAALAAAVASALSPPVSGLLSSPALRLAYFPLIAMLVVASAELFGAMATRRRDVDRAWATRLGTWIFAGLIGWTILCTLALGSTALWRDPELKRLASLIAALVAVAVLAVVWRSVDDPRERLNTMSLAVAAAGVLALLPLAAAHLARDDRGYLLGPGMLWWRWGTVTLFLLIVGLGCNANRFSLHGIYKLALARTFLGASRLALRNPLVEPPINGVTNVPERRQFETRRPIPAVNIDENDNPALAWMHSRPERELPVLLINAALNGTSLTDLEGRVPRQWPFTFSQRFSGSPANGVGYAPTEEFYRDEGAGGISLAGAMAVSGAAVSPTSGNLTNPVRALLLGFLNARLGMWIGNPRNRKALRMASPALGGSTVLAEMLGMRAKFGDWLHLSDGGHFENLGIYELISRGCLRIIAVDASCDPGRDFADLADAIRRARIDLGVRIFPRTAWAIHAPAAVSDTTRLEIGLQPDLEKEWGLETPISAQVKRSVAERSRSWMWFEIDYGEGLPRGRMLYVKPSVYKHQSLRAEVLNYWRESPEFPHESTMNQFFSERQMEAYRSLGESCMLDALQAAMSSTSDKRYSPTDRDPGLITMIKRSA